MRCFAAHLPAAPGELNAAIFVLASCARRKGMKPESGLSRLSRLLESG
jgi:hypothetical protein